MSYSTCLNCGQKSLSVATRCPHCGAPKGPHAYQERPPRRRVTVVILSIVALAAIILVGDLFQPGGTLFRRAPAAGAGAPSDQPEVALADSVAPPEPAAVTPPAPSQPPAATPTTGIAPGKSGAPVSPAEQPADSTPASPPPTPAPAPAPRPQPPPAPVAAEPVVAEPVAPALPIDSAAPGTGTQERVYARDWVNVRRARLANAEIIKVLRPGEPILVDSLEGGWYRVVIDSQTVGYVYRDFVASEPAARP